MRRVPHLSRYGTMAALSLLVAACATPTLSPTPTSTLVPTLASPMPPPTVTELPSVTETQTPTPFPRVTLPSEPIGANFYFGDLFFEDSVVPGCVLPCWRGLVIGQSKPADFQFALDSTFGFKDTVNSHIDSYALGVLGADFVPGIYAAAYHRSLDSSGMRSFHVVGGFEQDTNNLEIFGFSWMTDDISRFEIHISPQRVLDELGTPLYMLASVSPQGSFLLANVNLMMVYEQGIVFQFDNSMIPTQITYTDATQTEVKRVTVEFCLGDSKVKGAEYVVGKAYVLAPFKNGLDALSPLQEATVGRNIDHFHLKPIEEVLGMTSEEVTRQAKQEDNVCLQARIFGEQ